MPRACGSRTTGLRGNSGSKSLKKLVCICELQKDLKESAKLLIEDELQEFGDLQGKIYRNLLVILVGKASATIWAVRLGFLVGRSPSDDGDATVDFISLFPTVPRRRRNLDLARHATEKLELMFGSEEFDMAGKPAKIRTRDLFPAICAAQRAGLKEIRVRLNDGTQMVIPLSKSEKPAASVDNEWLGDAH